MPARNLLVIISGPPGAGKTTLARRLSDQMRLPVLIKDTIKEAMSEPFPEVDLQLSQQLGRASYEVLYAVAAEILPASGLILESNFHRGQSEPELLQLLALAPACEINCSLSADLCIERYVKRSDSGERHRAHLDMDRLTSLREGLQSGRYTTLDLDIPHLIVDTSDGFAPSIDQIIAFTEQGLVSRG